MKALQQTAALPGVSEIYHRIHLWPNTGISMCSEFHIQLYIVSRYNKSMLVPSWISASSVLVIHIVFLVVIIGASRLDGIPYGFADFFFFFFFRRFFRRHVLCPFIVKKTTDWAEILHNHTYGHASGRGKKYFRCAHFSLSYVSKITEKNFRNS